MLPRGELDRPRAEVWRVGGWIAVFGEPRPKLPENRRGKLDPAAAAPSAARNTILRTGLDRGDGAIRSAGLDPAVPARNAGERLDREKGTGSGGAGAECGGAAGSRERDRIRRRQLDSAPDRGPLHVEQ